MTAIFQLSSMDESTPDMVNRSCIIRIRNARPRLRKFDEGDCWTMLPPPNRSKLAPYIGRYAMVQYGEMLNRSAGEGRFRRGLQGWTDCARGFGETPLLEGHSRAQERGEPGPQLLRQTAIALSRREARIALGIRAFEVCAPWHPDSGAPMMPVNKVILAWVAPRRNSYENAKFEAEAFQIERSEVLCRATPHRIQIEKIYLRRL
jgi:hypothetical protein